MKFKRFFSYSVTVMLCCISFSILGKPQTVLTLDGTVKTISNIENCQSSNWSNSQENACACCLGEQKNSLDKTAEEIVDECKQKAYCTDLLVSSLKTTQQVNTASELVNTLYDKNVIIKQIHFDISPLLNAQNKFTEESLKTFLVQAFKTNKLPDKNFSDPACITVKDLAASGGGNTLQLFLVISTCGEEKAVYIIKQMAKAMLETERLEIIRNAPGMKELIAPNKLTEYPILALPLFYISYEHNAMDNYLAIMPAASGVSFEKLLEEYGANQSAKNTKILQDAFEAIGNQLGHFYEKFMVPHKIGTLDFTVIHGDLRAANLFYDTKEKQSIFIDAETMALSIKKPRTIFIDLMRFIHFSIGRTVFITGKPLSRYQKKLFDLALKSFVRGYLSAYPQGNIQQQIFYELERILTETPLTILSQVNAEIQPATMINFNKMYVKPLFKNLAQELKFT